MPELNIRLDEPYYLMLQSFKPVVENVIEEVLDFDTYVNVVISRGIKAMIEDIVPKDPQTLFQSVLLMHEANPEFVSSFINNMLTAGRAREEARERLGFIRDR